MSGKELKAKPGAAKTPIKTDKRVLRTRDALGDALVALMREKPFEEITVQHVLDRAGVGRSTFYTHFSDKDDLFLSDLEDFFEMFSTVLTRRGASVERIAPVAELFSHIAEMREFVLALQVSGKWKDVESLGRGFFARSFEERLCRAGFKIASSETAAQTHALAGSLFSLLEWWLDHGMKEDPMAMDAIFHRMAWKGIAAGL